MFIWIELIFISEQRHAVCTAINRRWLVGNKMAGSSQEDPFNYRPLKRSKLSLKRRQNTQLRPTAPASQKRPTEQNNKGPARSSTAAAEDPRQLKLIASQPTQRGSCVAGPSQSLLRLQERYFLSFSSL